MVEAAGVEPEAYQIFVIISIDFKSLHHIRTTLPFFTATELIACIRFMYFAFIYKSIHGISILPRRIKHTHWPNY